MSGRGADDGEDAGVESGSAYAQGPRDECSLRTTWAASSPVLP